MSGDVGWIDDTDDVGSPISISPLDELIRLVLDYDDRSALWERLRHLASAARIQLDRLRACITS